MKPCFIDLYQPITRMLTQPFPQKVQGELDEKKPQYLMLCEASAKEVPELEEPVCFELEAKTDKMKKLWNEVRGYIFVQLSVRLCISISNCLSVYLSVYSFFCPVYFSFGRFRLKALFSVSFFFPHLRDGLYLASSSRSELPTHIVSVEKAR